MRTFDYTKFSEWKWDSETLSLVAQIHEHKGRQELFFSQKGEMLERLVEIAKIQSTCASNKIEGIVTTDSRIKQLCLEKTTPQTRDEKEILGYRDVLNTIHENFEYIPIKSSYILQLHMSLYSYSGRGIGGRFKSVQNYISEQKDGGEKTVRFIPLDPFETPSAVENLCDYFNRELDSSTIDPLLLIPIFIVDFLCIHPFNDGNGRMSRLLTTLLLYKCGYTIGKYISIESKIEKNKSLYYDALQTSSKNWHEDRNDPTAFIKYMLSIILSAYRELEKRVSIVCEKQSGIETVRKAILQTIGKFTKNDLLSLCPNIGKSTIENSLKTLQKSGEILRHANGKNTFYTIITN